MILGYGAVSTSACERQSPFQFKPSRMVKQKRAGSVPGTLCLYLNTVCPKGRGSDLKARCNAADQQGTDVAERRHLQRSRALLFF